MAWEVRSPRVRRRDRVAIGAGIFAGIGLVKVIGSHMAGLELLHSLPMAFVLIALPVLAVLWMQRRDHRRRVAERLTQPVGVTLEYSPERVVERREDRSDVLAVGTAGLHDVLDSPEHLFLFTGADVIIVPRRAFATPDAQAAFLEYWQAQRD